MVTGKSGWPANSPKPSGKFCVRQPSPFVSAV